MCTSALQSLCLIPLLDALIQRLQHPGIDRRDYIDSSVQLLFRHPRFPCVRKAAIHSRVAEPHHRDGEADEHLLPLGKTFDGVGITVKSSEVGFLQNSFLPLEKRPRHACSSLEFGLIFSSKTYLPLPRSSNRSCSTLPGTFRSRRFTSHSPDSPFPRRMTLRSRRAIRAAFEIAFRSFF